MHLCSTLLTKGPAQARHVLDGIGDWMEEQGFETLEEMRGRVSALAIPNPAEFERANYVITFEGDRVIVDPIALVADGKRVRVTAIQADPLPDAPREDAPGRSEGSAPPCGRSWRFSWRPRCWSM